MLNKTINVKGMTCGHCVSSVEGSVGSLEGVDKVKVDLDQATVDVVFNPDQVTEEQIKETIDDQGFDVVS
ncbi:copper chaperone CopZ [Alkalicoccus luteus]|uniref:Copper chaperone CopZ n=1 Tax=Alkalicoccus luteus TaxID=1237094 RepID=A0A969PQP4_9BACI|nr:copper chaperone CopZ [Alkalicoccus luteus]NJP36198.1 copper chaperone CopZ [Alkalicoccus luteus]